MVYSSTFLVGEMVKYDMVNVGFNLSSWWLSFHPSGKDLRQIGSSPQGFGVKIPKIFELPPPIGIVHKMKTSKLCFVYSFMVSLSLQEVVGMLLLLLFSGTLLISAVRGVLLHTKTHAIHVWYMYYVFIIIEILRTFLGLLNRDSAQWRVSTCD